ncbi:1-acyl-sn-glycerol-3-phosphate acyltransferase [Flavihumibacter sp. R14]|nr:1-acyl-sn-glycerol-3-phosphate acyltransferase [Flavihumibacter soli]
MKKHLKKAHHFYYKCVIGLVFLFIYPFVYVYSRKPVNFSGMNRMRGILSRITSSLAGISFRFNYETPIDWSKTFIICANHTSNLDISTIILLVRHNFVFLGKEELLDNMVTKIYFETIDIPINRKSKISSYRGFKKAEEYLKKGTHVIIFPEGLIGNDYPPVLHPFKLGPFRLAIEHNVPILPVTIADNWRLLWDDGSRTGSRPGTSNVYVHEPVETADMKISDAEELRDHVYQLIHSKLNGKIVKQDNPSIAAVGERVVNPGA